MLMVKNLLHFRADCLVPEIHHLMLCLSWIAACIMGVISTLTTAVSFLPSLALQCFRLVLATCEDPQMRGVA